MTLTIDNFKKFCSDNCFELEGETDAMICADFGDEESANDFAASLDNTSYFTANVSDTSYCSDEDEENKENGWVVVTTCLGYDNVKHLTLNELEADYAKIN